MKIVKIGRYRSRASGIAIITRVDAMRAYGSMPGNYDRTWWYSNTGEHAICPPDDLVQKLEQSDIDNTATLA